MQQIGDVKTLELETGGYRYCHDCGGWFDDTGCFPGDHSRHCHHWIKETGVGPHSFVKTRCGEGEVGAEEVAPRPSGKDIQDAVKAALKEVEKQYPGFRITVKSMDVEVERGEWIVKGKES